MKLAAGLEYRGTHYFGWQRQQDVATIQGCIEQALTKIAGHPVQVVCAGRTDTGVHATKQVIHFGADVHRPLHAWKLGANVNLPEDISVLWVKPVDNDFHARFSAQSRTYHYYILNRRSKPAINTGLITWEGRSLDVKKMRLGSRYLIGAHDFNSFRSSHCQAKNALRTIYTIDLVQFDSVILLAITANAFLHHMVRNIVGSLIEIGSGKKDPEWMEEVLLKKDRRAGGMTAKAAGLYLYDITYPACYALPRATFPYLQF